MKILFLLDRPNLTGSERHFYELVQFVSNRDIEPIVVTFRDGPLVKKLSSKKIKVYTFFLPWCFIPTSLKKLIRLFVIEKPDIVHAHQPKAGLYASILCRVFAVPCVFTVHSKAIDHSMVKDNWEKYFVYVFHIVIGWFTQLLAARVIVLSNEMKRRAYFPLKTIRNYNWIGPRFNLNSVKKTINTPLRLLCVGTLSPAKGQKELIEVLHTFRHEIDFSLTIIGNESKSNYKRYLIDLSNNLDLIERIRWIDHVSDIQSAYLSHDVFILLTKSETFGLVFAEAMYCGLPVIASNISIAKEIIGDAGLCSDSAVEIKAYLLRLMYDTDYYSKISCLARQWARTNFSYHANASRTVKIYNELFCRTNRKGKIRQRPGEF